MPLGRGTTGTTRSSDKRLGLMTRGRQFVYSGDNVIEDCPEGSVEQDEWLSCLNEASAYEIER